MGPTDWENRPSGADRFDEDPPMRRTNGVGVERLGAGLGWDCPSAGRRAESRTGTVTKTSLEAVIAEQMSESCSGVDSSSTYHAPLRIYENFAGRVPNPESHLNIRCFAERTAGRIRFPVYRGRGNRLDVGPPRKKTKRSAEASAKSPHGRPGHRPASSTKNECSSSSHRLEVSSASSQSRAGIPLRTE